MSSLTIWPFTTRTLSPTVTAITRPVTDPLGLMKYTFARHFWYTLFSLKNQAASDL
uniref:Uncharacterized protein n=1 Tax=Magnetococcus massalia (strain MO-1) TaxID=451514 RepID=A0A1S7LGD8_MAGMO|nr:Protein of unknown function [Candidatus Magnetococcus massalia]